jgi:hypothetical protein
MPCLIINSLWGPKAGITVAKVSFLPNGDTSLSCTWPLVSSLPIFTSSLPTHTYPTAGAPLGTGSAGAPPGIRLPTNPMLPILPRALLACRCRLLYRT